MAFRNAQSPPPQPVPAFMLTTPGALWSEIIPHSTLMDHVTNFDTAVFDTWLLYLLKIYTKSLLSNIVFFSESKNVGVNIIEVSNANLAFGSNLNMLCDQPRVRQWASQEPTRDEKTGPSLLILEKSFKPASGPHTREDKKQAWV